jgi:PRTRC genetic system protein A
VLVAPSPFALPYGVVKPTVAYRHGAPSPDLLRRAIQRAAQVAPNEWAGVIVLDRDGYRLVEPPALLATPGAVSYATTGLDSDALVIDLHSHGDGSAFFSPTDDASDREGGIYIATVLGRCRSTTPKMVSRLVVNGHFFPFEAHALTPGHYREMRSDYQ